MADSTPTLNDSSRQLALWASLVGLAVTTLVLPPLRNVPDILILPLADWTGQALEWVARDAGLGGVTVAQVTRALGNLVEVPINMLRIALADGWVTGAGFNERQIAPPLSWLGITLALTLVAWRIADAKLAVFVLLAGFYLAFFGLWASAMTTLASVLLCVVMALLIGLAIGIRSYRSPRSETAIRWIMNVMQTVPIFSYLLPTLLLFGYGPSAALIATVVYALPPMVHATVLALRAIPDETLELADMTGCSRRQRLLKVELPVAVPRLAIGLNQVVMMTLNMVIIASMIGAGGLGYDVLRALRRLDFGAGLEAGIGIVLIAVVIDRLTQSAAVNQTTGRHGLWRRRYSGVAIGLIIISTGIAFVLPALAAVPEAWTLTIAPVVNDAISFINRTMYDTLDAVRTFALLNIMRPLNEFLLSAPWSLVILLLAGAGWRLGGAAVGAGVAALTGFIAVSGYWTEAMGSVYLTFIAVVLALVLGMPFGIWVAGHRRWREPVRAILDTLQTLPTLVYLLPAVMLFRNGDFAALIAVLFYAIAPAVRYGLDAMTHVPVDRIEAAEMVGCSRWQAFRYVGLPAAAPTLLLGVNQTIMMALSMLVIAALVGTRELGQEVFTALARGETGPGIVAGLCVACIALIADTLLKEAAARAARRSGATHA